MFTYKAMEGIRISLPGTYQLENGALALEAASALSRKGIHIPESAMRKGLSNVSLAREGSRCLRNPHGDCGRSA